MSKKKMIMIMSLVCVICAALLLVSLFLPFTKMSKEEAESTMSAPAYNLFNNSKIKYTNHDLVRISLFKYTRIYSAYWEGKIEQTFYIVIFALLAGFAALTLLFSVLRKPVPIIVFDILFFGVTLFNNEDYTSRGIVSDNSSYHWGIAHALFLILPVIVLIGAIAMIVFKVMEKKERNKLAEVKTMEILNQANNSNNNLTAIQPDKTETVAPLDINKIDPKQLSVAAKEKIVYALQFTTNDGMVGWLKRNSFTFNEEDRQVIQAMIQKPDSAIREDIITILHDIKKSDTN